jgi:ligand-binding sensor domain-containing protein
MRKAIQVILSILFFQCIHAQFPYVQKFNHPAQPPTQVIYDMLADKEGYIWLGTDKGLYRFNGHSFTEIPFESTKLRSVSYLQQDPDGVVWCMNFYKELFYIKNDTLRKFSLNDKLLDKAGVFLNISISDKDIWIGAVNQVYQINKRSGLVIRSIFIPNAIGATYSTYGNNKFYAYSGKGYLLTFPAPEWGWKKVPYELHTSRLFTDGKKIIASSIGAHRKKGFIIDEGGITEIPALNLRQDAIIYHFATTGDSRPWICTQAGAYLWDLKTGETTCILPDESVTDVVKDYQGNYWFSTLDNGLFVCPSLRNFLYKINPGKALDNITKIDAISSHKIITGSSKGLISSFDIKTNKLFKYSFDLSREVEFVRYDKKKHLIFTNRGILKEKDKEPLERADYSKQAVVDIFGNAIVASFNRAYIINNKYGAAKGRMPRISNPLYASFRKSGLHDYIDSALIIRDVRTNIALTSRDDKTFWIAYEDGLYAYQYAGSIQQIVKSDGSPLIVRCLVEDEQQRLIAGTTNDGVYIIQDGKVVGHFGKDQGLISNNIKQCRVFGKKIWVLTDDSLAQIDIENNATSNVLDAFGLEEVQVNDFVITEEAIYLATTNGLLASKSKLFSTKQAIRFIQLKGFANGLFITPFATLSYNKNNIIFQIEALHYKSATSLFYKYKLQGVDSIWKNLPYYSNSLAYNRLTPGKYSLLIQASDIGGKYQSAMMRFDFAIAPPFWKRWWFILIILFSFLGAGYFAISWWTNRLLTRETLKEKLFKSQLVALRSQMNPHFLYNVLNTVQGLVYDNKKIEAGNLLGNFSDLMRKTLEASDKQLQTLQDETENLRLYLELEKARFDNDFEYEIRMDLQNDISTILIPSLLLQPLAENAVKHGLMHKQGFKKLVISFMATNNGMLVKIDDNGIGRKHSSAINARNKNKPAGFATKALSERVSLFNKLYASPITYTVTDKLDNHDQPAGTCVELLIPYYHLN